MVQLLVHRFDGAESRLEQASFGARFSVRGVVDGSNVCGVIGRVVRDLSPVRPLVALCDYSRADMGVAARSILAAHRKPGLAAGWPAAIVVQADHLEIWRDYAWLQGQSGGLRGIFTSLEAAEKWAAEIAALRESEDRLLKRGRLR